MTSLWPRCAHNCGSPAEWMVTDNGVTLLVCPRGALGMTGKKRRLSIADVPGYIPTSPEGPSVNPGPSEGDAAKRFPERRSRRSVALSGAG